MGVSKTQQQSSNQSNNSFNQTQTPTQSGEVTSFRNSLLPQTQSLFAQSQKPVYGNAQYASQLNNLNQLTNSSIDQLTNAIAGKGGNLNSGGYGAGVAGLLQNRNNQLSNYQMQVPALNQQAALQGGLQVTGLQNTIGQGMPTTVNNSGFGSQSGSSDSTTTQSQSPLGIFSSLLGAAAGGITGGLTGGASSLFKGLLGGLGGAASSAISGPSVQSTIPFPQLGGGSGYNPNGQFGYEQMYNPYGGGGFA